MRATHLLPILVATVVTTAVVLGTSPLAAQEVEPRGPKSRIEGGGGKGKAAHKKEPVASAVLDYVAYDARKSVLTLYFDNGGVYEYEGVPEPVHRGLMSAECIGCFFNREIRGPYRFKRLDQ